MSTLKFATVPVTPFQQNCTLVWDEATGEAAVIDPGGEAAKIARAVARLGVNPTAIWLTHGHLDHAGGVEDLRSVLDARPGAEPVEVIGPDARDGFLLGGIERQAREYGLSGLRDAVPDRYLAEGDTVSVGDQVFEVLHCPGHTPGHVVFVNKAARWAQLGDVLFAGSVGRTDFPYGNHEQLIDAITGKLLPLGDDLAFVCGHGPASTIGRERRSNPFIQR